MTQDRDTSAWAKTVSALHLTQVPDGALNLNVEGRRLVGPIQGFGQMWQRTYRIRLSGVRPSDVVARLKTKLPNYQPPENRFYPSLAGVRPGEILLINATVSGMPVSTGVLVLYADDNSFTLMTPQGNPESGWNTFSAYEEHGATVAQIQSIARANDPIFEFGFRFMGGAKVQRRIWTHVLQALAADCGAMGEVEVTDTRVDPKLQWSHARNVWHNSIIRTTLYKITAPLRRIRRKGPGRPTA
jgi:hypothetical protein